MIGVSLRIKLVTVIGTIGTESNVSVGSLYSYYLQSLADFRGESICRLSWKVFADFGGNNARISL